VFIQKTCIKCMWRGEVRPETSVHGVMGGCQGELTYGARLIEAAVQLAENNPGKAATLLFSYCEAQLHYAFTRRAADFLESLTRQWMAEYFAEEGITDTWLLKVETFGCMGNCGRDPEVWVAQGRCADGFCLVYYLPGFNLAVFSAAKRGEQTGKATSVFDVAMAA
jgi:hypothetical protein